MTNVLKCRFCAWTCPRFRGKNVGTKNLFTHVYEEHEVELAALLGTTSMEAYLDAGIDNDQQFFGALHVFTTEGA